MPITNGVPTCINHPRTRLLRNDRPVVLHPVDLIDAKPAPMLHRGMFLAPYICPECGYAEFYVVDKEQLSKVWKAGD